MRDVTSSVFLILGAFLMLTSALGVLRFPGPVARLHAATKAATTGLASIALGAGVALGPAAFTMVVLVIVFQTATAPVAGHLLGRAALRSVPKGRRHLVRDELDAVQPAGPQPRPAAGRFPWGWWLLLTALWPALWADLSIANVAGGAVLAAVVLAIVRPRAAANRPSVVGVIRFLGTLLSALARGTFDVAMEVLTRDDSSIRQAVVTVEVPDADPRSLVLAAVAVTLTPGTLAIDVDEEGSRLVVHTLHYEEGVTEAEVLRLAASAQRAVGGPR